MPSVLSAPRFCTGPCPALVCEFVCIGPCPVFCQCFFCAHMHLSKATRILQDCASGCSTTMATGFKRRSLRLLASSTWVNPWWASDSVHWKFTKANPTKLKPSQARFKVRKSAKRPSRSTRGSDQGSAWVWFGFDQPWVLIRVRLGFVLLLFKQSHTPRMA